LPPTGPTSAWGLPPPKSRTSGGRGGSAPRPRGD